MKLVKVLIVLVLAAGIFGTAGFFAYQLFYKPIQVEKEEKKAAAEAPPPTPLPDYSLPALAKALDLKKGGQLLEAREALLNFLAQYPQSTGLAEAKAAIGEINTLYAFTAIPGPDKIDYVVAKGDSLVKVASKTKSNAELILRSNNLTSIDLQIGQALRVPQFDMAIIIDRNAKTLSLMNKGQLFKEYTLLGVDGSRGQSPVQTEVKDKIALKGSERVAFGSRDYMDSERWIMLGAANAVIRGLPEPEDGQPAALPPGIILSQSDAAEIFPLVTRGTPVTIQ